MNSNDFVLKQLLVNAGEKGGGAVFNQAPQPQNLGLAIKGTSALHVHELISTTFQKMHFSRYKRSGLASRQIRYQERHLRPAEES